MLSKCLKRFFTSFGFYLLIGVTGIFLIAALALYLALVFSPVLTVLGIYFIFIFMCLFLAYEEAVEEIAYA